MELTKLTEGTAFGAVLRLFSHILGLVRVRQQNNPGHGIVQMVEPVADKLVMQADI